jgi:purine catabolism regulator
MSITIRELLRLPHLQLSLNAGAGGLDREVSWVHTSDLPEPWEWLGAGELLLTNGTGLRPDEGGQLRFIERLAEAGASGLGISLGMSGPPLASRVAGRADELDLPLVAVPYSMPFTAVARAVADANVREESRQLGRVARLYELLRTSMLAGRPGPELIRRPGQELGVRLCLVDPETGLSVLADGEDTAFADALVASYAAHGRAIPGVLRLSRPGAAPGETGAVAVAVPGDQPTVLVAEPAGGQLPSLILLHHIATGGALELAQLAAAQERRRQAGAELLGQLLDRAIDQRQAETRLAEAGLDLACCVLGVLRAEPQAALSLHRGLDRRRTPHLLLHRDGLLYLLVPDGELPAALAGARVPAAETTTAAEPGGPWVPVAGSSDRVGPVARIPEAGQEARWALGAAEAEGRPLVRYGDQTALLLPRTAAEARVLVSRILGPLLEHDAGHGTDYVATLRAVLDSDRSWQQAAARLHVHKQTLGYRIRKIEQLTGRGLARTEDLAQWWFALRAHDLLSGHRLRLPLPARLGPDQRRPWGAQHADSAVHRRRRCQLRRGRERPARRGCGRPRRWPADGRRAQRAPVRHRPGQHQLHRQPLPAR